MGFVPIDQRDLRLSTARELVAEARSEWKTSGAAANDDNTVQRGFGCSHRRSALGFPRALIVGDPLELHRLRLQRIVEQRQTLIDELTRDRGRVRR